MRRLALVLLLVVPGVVVVWAGLRDSPASPPPEELKGVSLCATIVWFRHPGNLLGRVLGPHFLPPGDPPSWGGTTF